LQDALSKISRSLPIPPDSPFQLGYCFAPTLPPEHGDPVPVEPLFYEHGASSPFDYGSLTVCVYPGN
jgi:hypothetical protein